MTVDKGQTDWNQPKHCYGALIMGHIIGGVYAVLGMET